jgi:hypothetical protein
MDCQQLTRTMCNATDHFGDVLLRDVVLPSDDKHLRPHSHIIHELEPHLPMMFLAVEYINLMLMYESNGDVPERDLCSKMMEENCDVTSAGVGSHLIYITNR